MMAQHCGARAFIDFFWRHVTRAFGRHFIPRTRPWPRPKLEPSSAIHKDSSALLSAQHAYLTTADVSNEIDSGTG